MTNSARFTTQRRLADTFTMNYTMDIFENADAWEFQEDGNIIAVPLDNSYKEMARKGKSFAELFVAHIREQEGYDDYKKYLPVDIPDVVATRHISEPTCSVKGGRLLSGKQAEQRSHKKHSGAFRRSMASRKHSQAKKHRSIYHQRSETPEAESFVYTCPSDVSDIVTPPPETEEEQEYRQYLEDERSFWEMYDMRFAAQFGF